VRVHKPSLYTYITAFYLEVEKEDLDAAELEL